ncbi:MAG TPA: sulfotransferase, partial [Polyangiales bacterium]|nr:sulfotransferase [Polyangiales bacterium]
GNVPMTVDEILRAAQSASDLPEPDSDSWREGLDILLHDHETANTLSERGASIMRGRYTDALAARMRVDDFLRRHPQLCSKPIERPVFILGMPRTGTTLVSYMLDADPANRSLLKWEAYNGVPPAAAGALRTDPRCLAEKAKDEQIIKNNPKGAAQHFEAGDGPTECVHLLAQDFKSLMFAVLSTTPTYHDWLLFCDMRSAFEHRKRVYQVLQSTNPGRWVLKLPSDALFIRTLFETFPDAKVIWTHRDPYVALASSLSMRSSSQAIFNKQPDRAYIRDRFPLQLALHLARPLEISRERPDAIYHAYYDDLVSDPLGQMQKIYGWLGDSWSAEAESGMRAWLDHNPQGRFGRHSYSLEEWGLSERQLDPYFADYLRVHPVAKKRS